MTNEKIFSKSMIQKEFTNGLFTNLPKSNIACDFYPSLKVVSYHPQKRYLTTVDERSIQLEKNLSSQATIFLWAKLLKNLRLAKHLTSVSYLACTWVFYRPDHNAKGKPWIPKVFKCNEKHGIICLVIVFTARVIRCH